MKTDERFDCAKGEIQARLDEKYRGRTDEQIRERMHQELAASDGSAARLWRSLRARPDRYAGSGR